MTNLSLTLSFCKHFHFFNVSFPESILNQVWNRLYQFQFWFRRPHLYEYSKQTITNVYRKVWKVKVNVFFFDFFLDLIIIIFSWVNWSVLLKKIVKKRTLTLSIYIHVEYPPTVQLWLHFSWNCWSNKWENIPCPTTETGLHFYIVSAVNSNTKLH